MVKLHIPVRKPDLMQKEGTLERQNRIATPFFVLNKYLNLRQASLSSLFDIRNRLRKTNFFTFLGFRKSFFKFL